MAMNGVGGRTDVADKHLADALMAQAHAEHGNCWSELLDDLKRNTGTVRSPRPGANEYCIWLERGNLVDSDLVMTVNMEVCAELAQVLHEDVDEGVIVVDHDHTRCHKVHCIGACVSWRLYLTILSKWQAHKNAKSRVGELPLRELNPRALRLLFSSRTALDTYRVRSALLGFLY